MKWIVYIAKTKRGKIYTGITTEGTLKKHEVLYKETFNSRLDAKMREEILKKMSKNFKLEITHRKKLHA